MFCSVQGEIATTVFSQNDKEPKTSYEFATHWLQTSATANTIEIHPRISE